MEYQRHPNEPRPQVVQPQATRHEPKRGSSRVWKWLVVLFLIAAAAGGAYYWRDKEANENAKKQQAEITAFQQQLSTLNRELADVKKELADSKKAEPKTPTKATFDNIEAAVKTGNYAALQGLMASKVKVILAASEGIGDRTPAQAVTDVKYLDAGTDPWTFSLPQATLNNYQTGDYKQYFPDTAHVGKSANNYVVSFTFDDNAKINGIFMAADASLL